MQGILFENVDKNGKYCWGMYLNLKIIIMKSNEYVNVTKLCQYAKKQFKNWKSNKDSINLIKSFSKIMNLSDNELLILKNGGQTKMITGTYAHPKLVPHIACWASHEFAYKVSTIVNDFVVKDHKKKITEQEIELDSKNQKIDELMIKVDKMLKKTNDTRKDIKKISHQNDELTERNDEILSNVKEITKRQVPDTGDLKDDHLLVIIENNEDSDDENSDSDSDDEKWRYQALRLMNKSYSSCISRHSSIYPNMKILKKIECQPNSMNLWIRIKKQLGKNKIIDVSGSKFNIIKENYSIKNVIKDMIKINEERHNVLI